MKSKLLFTVFLFVIFKLNAQVPETYRGKEIVPLDKSISDIEAYYEEISDSLLSPEVLERRSKSLSFYEEMKIVSEPSTLSVIGTHWKYQFNRADQKKQYVLNWDTKIPIALGGKGWASRHWISSVHIEPLFKVRIFRNDHAFGDSSLPVRTPSLMGGITYFGTPLNWWLQDKGNYVQSHYFAFRGYHHSNGQDGQHFDSTGNVYVYNGDFGEQVIFDFMAGGIYNFYSKKKETQDLKEEQKREDWDEKRIRKKHAYANPNPTNHNRMLYWRLGYEWHPVKVFGIDNTSVNWLPHNLYGRHRFNLQVSYSIIPQYRDLLYDGKSKYYQLTRYQSKELFRFVWNFKLIADPTYNVGSINDLSPANIGHRINTNLTAYWRIIGTQGAAIFAQAGYYGSDNYNIYFQRQFVEFRCGLAYGFFKYPKR